MKIIVKTKFGSHLYGTNTENSDTDYKGIFLPTKEQIFLGNIPKSYTENTSNDNISKNTKDDIDLELYSLHYFIKLALEGQTVAIDMLHAPNNMIEERSVIWDSIVSNREKFYTKNLKAFIGYARRQASKYGIKGSRLNAANGIVKYLKRFKDSAKLEVAWGGLLNYVGDHCHFYDDNPNGIKQFMACGKILQETQKVGYTIEILEKFISEYGKRAELAAKNEGIDWKAVSHALRAAYQVKEILTKKMITFPLRQAEFLKEVKNGTFDYISFVAPVLEKIMDEVELLSEKSDLPMKPDKKFWDKFIIDTISKEYGF